MCRLVATKDAPTGQKWNMSKDCSSKILKPLCSFMCQPLTILIVIPIACIYGGPLLAKFHVHQRSLSDPQMTRSHSDEFSASTRREAWRRSGGRCEWPGCGFLLDGKISHYDHIKPIWLWSEDERHNASRPKNCQVLCPFHHSMKTGEEALVRAKANRLTDREANIRRPRQPMPGSRRSDWKRLMDGRLVRREK